LVGMGRDRSGLSGLGFLVKLNGLGCPGTGHWRRGWDFALLNKIYYKSDT
jgi:hypothetical protein